MNQRSISRLLRTSNLGQAQSGMCIELSFRNLIVLPQKRLKALLPRLVDPPNRQKERLRVRSPPTASLIDLSFSKWLPQTLARSVSNTKSRCIAIYTTRVFLGYRLYFRTGKVSMPTFVSSCYLTLVAPLVIGWTATRKSTCPRRQVLN
ncbi:hypothetical protein BDZ89DRAFT_359970 [Hymenopellis radicata]|nr:hypothetical protein BDZ89DRAFT_359970 [Hymenopellis radicata]